MEKTQIDKKYVFTASSILIVLLIISLLISYKKNIKITKNIEPVNYVAISINPEIEIGLNQNNEIISIKQINPKENINIDELAKEKNLKSFLNAYISKMKNDGYINKINDDIKLVITGDDVNTITNNDKSVHKIINESLAKNNVEANVITNKINNENYDYIRDINIIIDPKYVEENGEVKFSPSDTPKIYSEENEKILDFDKGDENIFEQSERFENQSDNLYIENINYESGHLKINMSKEIKDIDIERIKVIDEKGKEIDYSTINKENDIINLKLKKYIKGGMYRIKIDTNIASNIEGNIRIKKDTKI